MERDYDVMTPEIEAFRNTTHTHIRFLSQTDSNNFHVRSPLPCFTEVTHQAHCNCAVRRHTSEKKREKLGFVERKVRQLRGFRLEQCEVDLHKAGELQES